MQTCPICRKREATARTTFYLDEDVKYRVVYLKLETNFLEFLACESCSKQINRDSYFMRNGYVISVVLLITGGGIALGASSWIIKSVGILILIGAATVFVQFWNAHRRFNSYIDLLGYKEK